MKVVNIVLATYKPNVEYFEKLLNSLNMQTYPNIHLIIRDDSADEASFNNISNIIRKLITNFKYTIYKNPENRGSNKTFELLTEDADGDYIAYCDQDDIWEKDKISKLVSRIEDESAILCYSDLSIVDGSDKLIAGSFKDIHKRLNHLEGEGHFEYFLRRNSVTGCTMLINSDIAKKALPFCSDFYVHDHWLTLYASSVGKIAYVNEPLIRYRIHGNNQIGASMLSGINTREDYYHKKLVREKEKYYYLLKQYGFTEEQQKSIYKILNWTEKRINFFENKGLKNTIKVITTIKEDYQLVTFELIVNLLPSRVVESLIGKLQTK